MRLVQIRRYPVKGLRGYSLQRAEVQRIGLAGDRRWMIVDEAGKFVTQRQCPKLAQIDASPTARGVALRHATHGAIEIDVPDARAPIETVVVWRDAVQARVAESAGAYLSAFLEKPVRLVFLHDASERRVDPAFGRAEDRVSFADGFPMLITSAASLADLNGRLPQAIGMDRFRPSLVIDGAPAWAEDTWRKVRIGGLSFRIAKPCSRCAVPTLDPLTGEALDGNEPIRTLGAFHRAANGGIIFGQNAIPDDVGALQVGDPVEIVETGSSNLL
ncbi:MAG TPA: MOSC domain-containing protein [Roseiarcus sp.]|nr:MOSC domain-containing protein [Roseiarcus sp.]